MDFYSDRVKIRPHPTNSMSIVVWPRKVVGVLPPSDQSKLDSRDLTPQTNRSSKLAIIHTEFVLHRHFLDTRTTLPSISFKLKYFSNTLNIYTFALLSIYYIFNFVYV